MASTETLLAFVLAMSVFAFFPGPAILYTAAQTLARGRRAGLMAAVGLHVGGYVHVIAAALGVSAMLTHVPVAYAVLKLTGALYLIWLGIGLIRRSGSTETIPEIQDKTARRAFVESIIVEVFNPKAALFFLAFLPQFADPAASLPVALQLFILGFVTLVAFTAADLITVVMAATIAERTTGRRYIQRAFGWLGGGILVVLGARLALEARS